METLTTVQWLIYPIFSLVEAFCEKTMGCCKSERHRRTEIDKKL